MKKIFTLAIVALMAATGFAAEATFTFTTSAGVRALGLTVPASKKHTYIPSAGVTLNGVTLSTTSSNTSIYVDGDDDMYLYLLANTANGPQNFILSVENGYQIKSVEIKYLTSSYLNRLSPDSGTLTDYADTNNARIGYGTWEGAAQSVTFNTSAIVGIDNFTVTYEPKVTSGISDINANSVKSVRYFNLQGVESANPFEGLNIMVQEMSDGSKVATKILK